MGAGEPRGDLLLDNLGLETSLELLLGDCRLELGRLVGLSSNLSDLLPDSFQPGRTVQRLLTGLGFYVREAAISLTRLETFPHGWLVVCCEANSFLFDSKSGE